MAHNLATTAEVDALLLAFATTASPSSNRHRKCSGAATAAYIADPDGFLWEIAQPFLQKLRG